MLQYSFSELKELFLQCTEIMSVTNENDEEIEKLSFDFEKFESLPTQKGEPTDNYPESSILTKVKSADHEEDEYL